MSFEVGGRAVHAQTQGAGGRVAERKGGAVLQGVDRQGHRLPARRAPMRIVAVEPEHQVAGLVP